MKVVTAIFILLYSKVVCCNFAISLTVMNQQEEIRMNDKYIQNAWKFANSFVGKTIHAENDFDCRQFAKDSRRNAESHEWLYHCTNTVGLLGILRSREFWLTNLKNVNDAEESDRIDAPSYEKSYYVCCFSYDPNIPLEHWKEYGAVDDGVVIGVKRHWFSKSPIFMTTSHQKCTEDNFRILTSEQAALDLKIEKETNGYAGIDPYHIFDFGFYQIVYDDELKKNMLGECTIDWNGTSIAGQSITPSLPGIIKSCEGWCKRPGAEKYWKVWETEKEVRLKAGIHRLSNSTSAGTETMPDIYFRQVSIPLVDEAFDTIRISFSPNYGDREELLGEIKKLYPNSMIEVLN